MMSDSGHNQKNGSTAEILKHTLAIVAAILDILLLSWGVFTRTTESPNEIGLYALGMGVLLAVLLVLYVVVARREPSIISDQDKVIRFPRARRWVLRTLLPGAVIALGLLIYGLMQGSQQRAHTILIAPIDGEKSQAYRLTETIVAKTRDALQIDSNARVEVLPKPIGPTTSRSVAREIGREHDAILFVWGWYGLTKRSVPINLNFEVFSGPDSLDHVTSESLDSFTIGSRQELESFSLQMSVANEVVGIGSLIAGLSQLSLNNSNSSVRFITQAIDKLSENANINPAVLYYKRGQAHMLKESEGYRSAANDFSKAFELGFDRPDLRYQFAVSLMQIGCTSKGKQQFGFLASLEPRNKYEKQVKNVSQNVISNWNVFNRGYSGQCPLDDDTDDTTQTTGRGPSYSGGEGRTPARAIVIEDVKSHREGVRAEYEYLRRTYGEQGDDWKVESQELIEKDGETKFDKLTIKKATGESDTIYFDVSRFFAK